MPIQDSVEAEHARRKVSQKLRIAISTPASNPN